MTNTLLLKINHNSSIKSLAVQADITNFNSNCYCWIWPEVLIVTLYLKINYSINSLAVQSDKINFNSNWYCWIWPEVLIVTLYLKINYTSSIHSNILVYFNLYLYCWIWPEVFDGRCWRDGVEWHVHDGREASGRGGRSGGREPLPFRSA